jgi:hypothetical protein
MTFRTFKTLAVASLALAGIAMMPGQANAQAETATVTASIITDAGITAAVGDTMDFGTWLLGVSTGDEAAITMDTAGAITVTSQTGTAQAIDLGGTNTGTPGTVTVDLPTGADGIELQMERGAITQFGDTNIVLSDIVYVTATEAIEAPVDEAVPVVVTVVTGGTPETVTFGGTITASETPADNTHTATFDVTFGY